MSNMVTLHLLSENHAVRRVQYALGLANMPKQGDVLHVPEGGKERSYVVTKTHFFSKDIPGVGLCLTADQVDAEETI